MTDMNWWSSEAERPQPICEALQQIEAEIPRLRRYARYLGHEPDHADDLVREGLGRAVAEVHTAIASIHTGPPGTSLRGWLFAILRSCHIEETRRGQRPDAPASTREAASPTTRRNQEAGAALSELSDAYLSLSEERREVLLLVAIEGLLHEEAAAILGVPLGAVRSRLSQGRQALRQALEAGRAALASPLPAHRMQGIST
jgi:RNA polymerase sigma-70 factor (ECF subfamily)